MSQRRQVYSLKRGGGKERRKKRGQIGYMSLESAWGSCGETAWKNTKEMKKKGVKAQRRCWQTNTLNKHTADRLHTIVSGRQLRNCMINLHSGISVASDYISPLCTGFMSFYSAACRDAVTLQRTLCSPSF